MLGVWGKVYRSLRCTSLVPLLIRSLQTIGLIWTMLSKFTFWNRWVSFSLDDRTEPLLWTRLIRKKSAPRMPCHLDKRRPERLLPFFYSLISFIELES